MSIYGNIISFNSGELSPLLDARSDVDKYRSSCRTLENFIVTPYGAVIRRPGLLYVAVAKYRDRRCRLIPFKFNTEQTYMMEFGHEYIRFFADGLPLTDDGGNLIEVVSPYPETALPGLKWVQSADVVFLVHPDYPPHRLNRIAVDEFTLTPFEYDYPPLLDPNLDDTTITPSATTGDITLTASEDIFQAGHVGSQWEIIHVRTDNEITGKFTANTVSSTVRVTGDWNLVTHNTWTGTLKVQRSFDAGATWLDYRTYTGSADRNVDVSGTEEKEDVLYRLYMASYASGTLEYEFRNYDSYNYGVVAITTVTDARHAAATVVKTLGGTSATKEWTEGAWSEVSGYPSAVAFYEERMMFAGTRRQPQTVWGSRTAEWNDFKTGDKDDDGICYTIVSDDVNAVRWLVSHDALLIGTVAAEWKMSSSSSDKPLTPSNVDVKRQSNYGGRDLRALLVGDTVLFVQRQGRKVREFAYNWEKNGYISPDLTIWAEHVTEGKIVDLALQSQPDNVLWCVRGDGVMAALTYERDQEVVGWHRHVTDGHFESVAVISGDDDDEIWVLVRRGEDRFIERFSARDFADVTEVVFLDSAVVSVPDGLTVSGLEHLNGRTVGILTDGAVHPSAMVTDGTLTLNYAAERVVVGIPYISTLQPVKIDLQMQDGSAQGRPKRISRLRVRLYRSVGGSIRVGSGAAQPIIMRNFTQNPSEAIPLYSGDIEIPVTGGWEPDGDIVITQSEPLPLGVVSLAPRFEVK